MDEYRTVCGFIGFPIDSFDDRTYVALAHLYIRFDIIQLYGGSMTVDARLLSVDPRTSNPEDIYLDCTQHGVLIGSRSITVNGTWQFSFSSKALDGLRKAVGGDQDHVFVGFSMAGTLHDDDYMVIHTSSYRSWISLWVDEDAPDVPALNDIPYYTSSNSISLGWSAVADNPSTLPNTGNVEYQVGVFSSQSTDDLLHVHEWTAALSDTIWNPDHGVRQFIRLRARDGNGFMSAWSAFEDFFVDREPPAVPLMDIESPFSKGTRNRFYWSSSADGESGLPDSPDPIYEFRWSDDRDLKPYTEGTTRATDLEVTGLTSGKTYYFMVRAMDKVGNRSPWSSVTYSTQDADPPTVPTPFDEPEFTRGTSNTFRWGPSTDDGVGIKGYYVEVFTGPGGTGTRVTRVFSSGTSATVPGLSDGVTYYCRVQSMDLFDHASDWSEDVSSTQDGTGPGPIGLQPLSTFSKPGEVLLEWGLSIDDGIGLGWFEVSMSTREDFADDVTTWDHVMGTSFLVPDLLSHHEYFFRVVPCDLLGNRGSEGTAGTKTDGLAPTRPVITAEPTYTAGTNNTIYWSQSHDHETSVFDSGLDRYVVRVYTNPFGSAPLMVEETDLLSLTVYGLVDGTKYWFDVTAVDVVGNTNASEMVSSTQDAFALPPSLEVYLPGFSKGTSIDVHWSPYDDQGSTGVEYKLEWADNAEFTPTLGQTGWTDNPYHTVSDLEDGVTYMFRVKAREASGQESPYGPYKTTTMDNSPPPVPELLPMPTFIAGPTVEVAWNPVEDGSGEPVEYQVTIFSGEGTGSTVVAQSPWTGATSYSFTELQEGVPHYARVRARDVVDWTTQPSDAVMFVIDNSGPTKIVLEVPPGYIGEQFVTLVWSLATDDGSGGIQYRLMTYKDPGLDELWQSTSWHSATSGTATGLQDGATYWFIVESRDASGNLGERSNVVSTTVDRTPPELVFLDPEQYTEKPVVLYGTCSDEGSGVATITLKGHYVTEQGYENYYTVDATVEGDEWYVGTEGIESGTYEAWLDAFDNVNNRGRFEVEKVDIEPPVVKIISPSDGDYVNDTVGFIGYITDPNLVGYIVEYRQVVSENEPPGWETVIDIEAYQDVVGYLAFWEPDGLEQGAYTIRFTATDSLGFTTQHSLVLNLQVEPMTIRGTSLVEDYPAPDGTPREGTYRLYVDVYMPHPYEGVHACTIFVYVGGVQVESFSPATNLNKGWNTLYIEFETDLTGIVTVRVVTPDYDTGEFYHGTIQEPIEAEATLEDQGGILGLLALSLALIALVAAILPRTRGGSPTEEPLLREEELLEPVFEGDDLEVPPDPEVTDDGGSPGGSRPRTHVNRK